MIEETRVEFEKEFIRANLKGVILDKQRDLKIALWAAQWIAMKCRDATTKQCPDMADITHCHRCHEHIAKIIVDIASSLASQLGGEK